MHKRNRYFIIASLAYGLIGIGIILTWLINPTLFIGNIPKLHGHIMLLGFISMMIFGIALHIIPRFSGRPLFSERLANMQLYIANIGLIILSIGWILLNTQWQILGGSLYWINILLFASNIILTVRHYGPKG